MSLLWLAHVNTYLCFKKWLPLSLQGIDVKPPITVRLRKRQAHRPRVVVDSGTSSEDESSLTNILPPGSETANRGKLP